MDTAFWLQLASPIIQAVFGVVVSIAGAFIARAMQARNLDAQWFEAISRAGGAAYAALTASGKPITSADALQAAARAGAQYLAERAADVIRAKGGRTDDELAQIAGAELGKLLAADPTIGPAVTAGANAALDAVRGVLGGATRLVEPGR